jgi:hypothetical protein
MVVLKDDEAKALIDKIGPHLGYDHTYSPVFPENRNDVCAVNRMVENGSTYGYNIIYLVWKDASRRINYAELINTRSSKDYMSIDGIIAENNSITVKVSSGGSYSGKAWKKEIVKVI